MELPITSDDVRYVEGFLAAGDIDAALPLLRRYAQMVEEWAQEECIGTDKRQWFSFSNAFERLAYRRVEGDPRELVQVDAPLDRLYSALGFACIQKEDWEGAKNALMQAVRWNPMNCAYRLNLADVFHVLGDVQEWAGLSKSVVDRAADASACARAYANLGEFFLDTGNPRAAAGCLNAADGLAAGESRALRLRNRIMKEAPEALDVSEGACAEELELQGVPAQPNAEVAICLLMCASDAAAAGDTDHAATFTVQARDLVGEDAAKALIRLIRESDAELAQERSQRSGGQGSDGHAES